MVHVIPHGAHIVPFIIFRDISVTVAHWVCFEQNNYNNKYRTHKDWYDASGEGRREREREEE